MKYKIITDRRKICENVISLKKFFDNKMQKENTKMLTLGENLPDSVSESFRLALAALLYEQYPEEGLTPTAGFLVGGRICGFELAAF